MPTDVEVPRIHDDVIKWKHFRVTGYLCGEFTGHRWIPCTKASDAELGWFFFYLRLNNGWVNNREAPSCPLWRHCNVLWSSADMLLSKVLWLLFLVGIFLSCQISKQNCLAKSIIFIYKDIDKKAFYDKIYSTLQKNNNINNTIFDWKLIENWGSSWCQLCLHSSAGDATSVIENREYGDTAVCHNDDLQCHQWRQSLHYDNCQFSMGVTTDDKVAITKILGFHCYMRELLISLLSLAAFFLRVLPPQMTCSAARRYRGSMG